MTIKEYDEIVNVLSNIYKQTESNYCYDKLSEFQSNYMHEIMKAYKEEIGDSQAKATIYKALTYAIEESESGSAIVRVKSEAVAKEVDAIIWQELGDYLLDYEIYEDGDEWVVNCIFAGNYIPYWNGWKED